MRRAFIIPVLLMALLAWMSPAQAAANAAKKTAWVEILPTKTNSDPAAVKVAQALLKGELKLYVDPKSDFFLAARYFNAPGLQPNSFIIAKFEGFNYCGSMGCMTYFLKRTDPKKNVWKIVHENNFSSITTSDDVLKLKPAFYTKGTGGSSYRRYNAATEGFEQGQ